MNQLLLASVSSDDTGNYSCAVRDQKHLASPALTLSVRCTSRLDLHISTNQSRLIRRCTVRRHVYIFSDPPKSVSVSISASAEIKEGDSVTLNCSSDSQSPALNFSWFKENQSSAVGSGQSFIISSFNSSHSGRYYCEAQNQYGSQRSASVSVKGEDHLCGSASVSVSSAGINMIM